MTTAGLPTVSVIVPVLNEVRNLPACLAAVGTIGDGLEVIVVDAGSQDGSADRALALGARVLKSSAAQRATQMNLGAQCATGDVLVFLHADTVLPPDWLAVLQRELSHQPEVVGGVFRRRFLRPSYFLRVTCWLADGRARRFGWFLGDQTIFVRRTSFRAAGGFPRQQAFEDLEFSLHLRRQGPTVVLPVTALSSGRRFDARGPLIQTLRDFRATVSYLRTRRPTDPTA